MFWMSRSHRNESTGIMHTLSIDPGRDTGWAIHEENRLVYCGLGNPPMGEYSLVIIERPQVYPSDPVDPNDLITVAIGVGRYVERFRENPISLVLPATWKGQVPKPIHNRRVLDALSEPERLLYIQRMTVDRVPEAKRNNVVDAIGLGRWSLTNRGRCVKFKV